MGGGASHVPISKEELFAGLLRELCPEEEAQAATATCTEKEDNLLGRTRAQQMPSGGEEKTFVPLFNFRHVPPLLSLSSCQPSPRGSSLHGYTQWLRKADGKETLALWELGSLLTTWGLSKSCYPRYCP